MRPANSFSPGPWSIRGAAPLLVEGPPHSKEFPGRPVIANVGGSRPNDAANARLIAAAPDLLASLTDAAIRCAGLHGDKFREHRCVTCSKWLDVIAKAVAP